MIAAPTLLRSASFPALRSDRRANPNLSPCQSPCQSPRRSTVVSAAAFAPSAPVPALSPTTSLYEVLGLPSCASTPEIKAAYRRLALSCHPDVVSVERRDTSADLFMRVRDAYSTLSDPAKRAAYDRELLSRIVLRRSAARPQATASSSSYPGGLKRRTWETDQCW